MEKPQLAAPKTGRELIDYVYVSFHELDHVRPTDSMPLTVAEELVLQMAVSADDVLLVTARTVNIFE